MSRHHKENIKNFNGIYSAEKDFNTMQFFFQRMNRQCAQCEYSELIDLQQYQIKRNPMKIKMLLQQKKEIPFVFINCLN